MSTVLMPTSSNTRTFRVPSGCRTNRPTSRFPAAARAVPKLITTGNLPSWLPRREIELVLDRPASRRVAQLVVDRPQGGVVVGGVGAQAGQVRVAVAGPPD